MSPCLYSCLFFLSLASVVQKQGETTDHMGVAQNSTGGVTQVLINVSTYQGSILGIGFLSHSRILSTRWVAKPRSWQIRNPSRDVGLRPNMGTLNGWFALGFPCTTTKKNLNLTYLTSLGTQIALGEACPTYGFQPATCPMVLGSSPNQRFL